jgi:nicotinamidase-related amidase
MKRLIVPSVAAALLAGVAALATDPPAPQPASGKPALIVMDIQNAYLPYMDEGEAERAMEMINATIALFRAQGLPVIRVYHTDPAHGPAPGTEAFEFPKTVAIESADTQVVKSYPSAFAKTELAALLREKGCDTVFLCGLSATGCVLATYFDAMSYDLEVFMVRGGLISHRHDLTKSVEEITGAIGYDAIRYMVAHAAR